MAKMQVIEHYDCGGQTYVTEPGKPNRLARPDEDLDRLLEMEGVVIERMPVYDPPLLIGRHLAEEPCDICRQLVGSAKKRRRK